MVMAIPGFTADESVGPTLQVYRSLPPMHETRGLRPQNLDAEEMAADGGDDLDEAGDDLDQEGDELLDGDDDDGDAAGDEATMEEDSSSGDA
jgi:hypothetical protein